ncbi:hypothetical protein AEGHOMDF_0499 [Methylobacterium soli]|nr:hypothetical protein AEGHOMDF_0499 [Methylobacterium soli]
MDLEPLRVEGRDQGGLARLLLIRRRCHLDHGAQEELGVAPRRHRPGRRRMGGRRRDRGRGRDDGRQDGLRRHQNGLRRLGSLGQGLQPGELAVLRGHHGREVAHDAAQEADLHRDLLDARRQRGRVGARGRKRARLGGALDPEQALREHVDLPRELVAARRQRRGAAMGEARGEACQEGQRDQREDRRVGGERRKGDEPEDAESHQAATPAEDPGHRISSTPSIRGTGAREAGRGERAGGGESGQHRLSPRVTAPARHRGPFWVDFSEL